MRALEFSFSAARGDSFPATMRARVLTVLCKEDSPFFGVVSFLLLLFLAVLRACVGEFSNDIIIFGVRLVRYARDW